MKEMGTLSGVPIEPEEQTNLLNTCTSLPGVIGGGVPGGKLLVSNPSARNIMLNVLREQLEATTPSGCSSATPPAVNPTNHPLNVSKMSGATTNNSVSHLCPPKKAWLKEFPWNPLTTLLALPSCLQPLDAESSRNEIISYTVLCTYCPSCQYLE